MKPTRAQRRSWVYWVVLGLAAASLSSPAARADCAFPAPAVDHLRSYRASFHAPSRLAVNADDTIYVADPRNGRLLARAADGRIVAEVRDLGFPVSVGADPRAVGSVFVGDGNTGSVTAFSPDLRDVLFQLGRGSGELLYPGDIAVANGEVFVTDHFNHEVRVYDSSGGFLRSFGSLGDGDGQFSFPMGIAVTSDRVYVGDQARPSSRSRVQVFDLQGGFLSVMLWRLGSFRAGRLALPQGLWVDESGGEDRLFVVDAYAGRVQVVDEFGCIAATIGDYGEVRGLNLPTDLVIDSFGRLVVAVANGARLEMYGLDNYADPEAVIPAVVEIEPGTVDRQEPLAVVLVHLEVPGYRLAEVDASSLTANGVGAIRSTVGDWDGDGEADFRIEVDWSSLMSTLPAQGVGAIEVTGSLGAFQIIATGEVEVAAGGDADGDGVPTTEDRCPDTAVDALVDGQGCSIAQLCPCSGPAAEVEWRNHGAYVKCVGEAARAFRDADLIGASGLGAIVRDAARSTCGRQERERKEKKRRGKKRRGGKR